MCKNLIAIRQKRQIDINKLSLFECLLYARNYIILIAIIKSKYHHFRDEKVETQKDNITCLRADRKSELKLSCLTSQSILLATSNFQKRLFDVSVI